MKYTVMVSNIGCVHSGDDKSKADKEYEDYVKLSRSSVGRLRGEEVTMLYNGKPERGFLPTFDEANVFTGALTKGNKVA